MDEREIADMYSKWNALHLEPPYFTEHGDDFQILRDSPVGEAISFNLRTRRLSHEHAKLYAPSGYQNDAYYIVKRDLAISVKDALKRHFEERHQFHGELPSYEESISIDAEERHEPDTTLHMNTKKTKDGFVVRIDHPEKITMVAKVCEGEIILKTLSCRICFQSGRRIYLEIPVSRVETDNGVKTFHLPQSIAELCKEALGKAIYEHF